MIFPSLLLALATAGTRLATASIIYDGRAPFNLTNADLDVSAGPYLTVVKGALNASHYSTLLGHSLPPTPLWNKLLRIPAPTEQAISLTIDNSSVFVPGAGPPQFGFRRTELIAQKNGDHTTLVPVMESGVTAFHFSIKLDERKPLNYSHEYQIVFIEPNDGSHVFGIQLGSPFTIPTGILPAANAHSFKVLDHALNVIFQTPFSPCHWHNFAIQVDWDNRSLAVLYSKDDDHLAVVTAVVPNLSAASGSAGQGDFHFGVLKLPLVNPVDSTAEQGDVAHHGLQEGTTEGLLYSGVFVESVENGVSVGAGASIPKIG